MINIYIITLWDASRLAGLFREEIVFVASASSVSKWSAGDIQGMEVPTGYICLARASFVLLAAHRAVGWVV